MVRAKVRKGMPSVALDKAEFARPRRHDRDTGVLVSGRDHALQEETRTAALALAQAVKLMRRGKFAQLDARLREVRPK